MPDAVRTGDLVTVTPEKPAAGGRMIARHMGLVLLVAGAIPGEPVRVRIERVSRSMAYAVVEDVIEPHPSRRAVVGDSRCGGSVYAHINYPRQTYLKSEIIRDALTRLARIDPPAQIDVMPSPERGYRMRARVHLRNDRIGFFLENTHCICDVRESGQLLPETAAALDATSDMLREAGLRGDADLDVSENIGGDRRAVHVDVSPDARFEHPRALGPVPGVTGLTWSRPAMSDDRLVSGSPYVEDTLSLPPLGDRPAVSQIRFRRHVRAFFQGNRFLVNDLVAAVVAACPPGRVVDLYAGVGLFGVCLSATGQHEVTAVEAHPRSAADLAVNAQPYADTLEVRPCSVERYTGDQSRGRPATLILDPPRSGMSREAMAGALGLEAERVLFVSCDVATFARDVRRFVDAGYHLAAVRGFDLFPATAHVEVMAVLSR